MPVVGKAVIDQITEAVVGRLAYGSAQGLFVTTFTPEKKRTIDTTLQSDALKFHVVPIGLAPNQAGRDTDINEYLVDYAIMQKLPKEVGEDETRISMLTLLVEQTCRFLRKNAGRIDDKADDDDGDWEPVDGADRVTTEVNPLYDHARLRDAREFVSVQRITYHVGDDGEYDG